MQGRSRPDTDLTQQTRPSGVVGRACRIAHVTDRRRAPEWATIAEHGCGGDEATAGHTAGGLHAGHGRRHALRRRQQRLALELVGAQRQQQLRGVERVAPGVRDEAGGATRRERPSQQPGQFEQLRRGEALEADVEAVLGGEALVALELAVELVGPERHDGEDPVPTQPPQGEQQRLQRDLVRPVRIVHRHHDRPGGLEIVQRGEQVDPGLGRRRKRAGGLEQRHETAVELAEQPIPGGCLDPGAARPQHRGVELVGQLVEEPLQHARLARAGTTVQQAQLGMVRDGGIHAAPEGGELGGTTDEGRGAHRHQPAASPVCPTRTAWTGRRLPARGEPDGCGPPDGGRPLRSVPQWRTSTSWVHVATMRPARS